MRKFIAVIPMFLATGVIFGQQPGHDPAADCPLKKVTEASPYTGLTEREIKALSQEDRSRLLEGHGMGLALAAELNHFPGPKHVLELAAALGLNDEQIVRTRAIFAAMQQDAQRLGRRVIDLEADLDARFARNEIDESALSSVVTEIGRVRGELRLAHLRAHLQMRAAMDRNQIATYARLRGYSD